jgi:hypothetical protein
MNELQRRIEQVANDLEKKLPVDKLNAEKIERAKQLVERLRCRSSASPSGSVEGVQNIVNPFGQSDAMNDLRELLMLCRDVIIPYEMKKQIANLRAVGQLAGARD